MIKSELTSLRLLACLLMMLSGLNRAKMTHELTKDASISWQFLSDKQENDKFELTITKTRPGWLAFGFGLSMKDAEIVKLERDPADYSRVLVETCYLNGHRDPVCSGIAQSWAATSILANRTYFRVTLVRNSDRVDQGHGKDIYRGHNDMIWAYTDSEKLEYHDMRKEGSNFGTLAMNLKKGNLDESLKWGFIRHEYVEFFIWVFVADSLIYLALYAKWFPYWQLIHLFGFSIVFFFSYFAGHAQQSNWKPVDTAAYKKESSRVNSHKNYSNILLYLTLVQFLCGIVLELINLSPAGTVSRRFKYWLRLLHRILGSAVWLIARIAVFIGVLLYYTKFNHALLIVVLIVETVAFSLGLAYLQYKRFKVRDMTVEEYNKITDDQINKARLSFMSEMPQDSNVIDDLRKGMTRSQLNKLHPDRTVVVHANKVYDLTGFNHPGGMAFLRDANWMEVSRYLLGVTGIEKNAGDVWKHSKNAFAELDKRAIGYLYEEGQGLESHWPLILKSDGRVSFVRHLFTMVDRQSISKSTSIVKLSHVDFNVNVDAKGVRWLGRHYLLSVPELSSKIRIYSHCQSMASEMILYDRELLSHFHRVIQGKEDASSLSLEWPTRLDYLPLVIKKYESDFALSKIIHGLALGDKILVDGPYGTGFPLTEDLRGDVLLVAGGTGIIPFIDLINFLLKKAMSMALTKRSKSTQFILPSQDYNRIFRGCRFTLACSFQHRDDFVFHEIVQQLVSINDDYGLGMFKCFLRLDDPADDGFGLPRVQTYFDENFLRLRLAELSDLQRILICGPDKMNTGVFNTLTRNMGVDEDIIIYV